MQRPFECCALTIAMTLVGAAAFFAETAQSDGPRFTCIPTDSSRGLDDWAHDIALGDLNGDGHLDALVACRRSCSVWIGNGKGNFTHLSQFSSDRVHRINLVDLEGDNKLDAVVSGVLWKNDGAGVFSKGAPVFDGQGYPCFCDLDSDGDLDAVTGENLTIHWNDGMGKFKSQAVQLDHKTVGQIMLKDMDQDRLADIVIWGREECRIVFNGNGRFEESRQIELRGDESLLIHGVPDEVRKSTDWFRLVPNSYFGPQVIWDDFDGDNDVDVATVQYGWDAMSPEDYIWLQDGAWRFQMSQVIGGYEQWSSEAAHADFDQDGDVDLFIGQDGGTSKLWLNDGKGKFSACSFNFGSGVHAVAVGDIDGDGDVDIFTVGCAPSAVWVNETIRPETDVKQ